MADYNARKRGQVLANHAGDYERVFRYALELKKQRRPAAEIAKPLDTLLQDTDGAWFKEVREHISEYVDDLATRIAMKAKEAADSILASGTRLETYRDIAIRISPHNMEVANALIESIPLDYYKNDTKYQIAKAISKIDPKRGHELAKKLPWRPQKNLVFEIISNCPASIHPDYASKREVTLVQLARSAKIEEATPLLRELPHERAWDYTIMIRGLTYDCLLDPNAEEIL